MSQGDDIRQPLASIPEFCGKIEGAWACGRGRARCCAVPSVPVREALTCLRNAALASACKASQTDPAFQVVARVEAFIAGWGLEEALKRSEAYADAGADAILMHRCAARRRRLPLLPSPLTNVVVSLLPPTASVATLRRSRRS